jgi:Xaa-Pro aminopeptidase
MTDRMAARREALWSSLRTGGINALLVSSVTNVRYLTGFTGEDSILLLTADRALVVSDGRYEEQLDRECPGLEVFVRPVGQLLIPAVAEVVGKLGLGSLAIEADALTMADFETLREALPAVPLKSTRGQVEVLRAIKDGEEVATIRRAIDQAERAFAMLRAGMRRDESEKDVADLLEGYLRRCGAAAASFPPIVAVGRNAALPHYRGTAATRIRDDSFVLIDWGACEGLYKSDLTRVLVTGNVTPVFEQVYRLVLAAQECAITAIRPGVVARDVDSAARAVIEAAGFGPGFQHGLGHGLGMDIHEAPMLRKESETALRPGMVVTVEPGIYVPDWGGVRIEDDVLVTADGAEVLSRVPKALDSARL